MPSVVLKPAAETPQQKHAAAQQPGKAPQVAQAQPAQHPDTRNVPRHRITFVNVDSRIREITGVLADQRVNAEYLRRKEDAFTMENKSFLGKCWHIATAVARPRVWKAGWFRMKADAVRKKHMDDLHTSIADQVKNGEEVQAVLKRYDALARLGTDKGEFGEEKVNTVAAPSRLEGKLRTLAVEYLSGSRDDAGYESEKEKILASEGIRDQVDNSLHVLQKLKKQCAGKNDKRIDSLLGQIDFSIWKDSTAARETLKSSLFDKTIGLLQKVKIGNVPTVATLVSVGVFLVKGGLGTRQIAAGTAAAAGAGFTLGAAFISWPVLAGFAAGTAVASAFAYFRRGKELKKDLNQVRTEKVLSIDANTSRLSKKDQLFRDRFTTSASINVADRIVELQQAREEYEQHGPACMAKLAKLFAETDKAIHLSNNKKFKGNIFSYHDGVSIARERLELLEELGRVRDRVNKYAKSLPTTPDKNSPEGQAAEFQNSLRGHADAFAGIFASDQKRADKEFASYRRKEQILSAGTTVIGAGIFGGAALGASVLVHDLSFRGPASFGKVVEYLSDAKDRAWNSLFGGQHEGGDVGEGVVQGESAPSSEEAPPPKYGARAGVVVPEDASATPTPVAETTQPTIPVTPAPEAAATPLIDIENPPEGVVVLDNGNLQITSDKVDPQLLENLKKEYPDFTEERIKAQVLAETHTHTITNSLLEKQGDQFLIADLAREYHYDNGTAKFDKNELQLHFGGRQRTGIDADGNIVYDVSRMFREPSTLISGGKRVSLDVRELLTNPGDDKYGALLLRLDKSNPNECIIIPVNSDGSIIIPEAIKDIAYNTNGGKANFLGWKASFGVVSENAQGQAVFGEIATDKGSGFLNGRTETVTTAGSPEIVGYTFKVPVPVVPAAEASVDAPVVSVVENPAAVEPAPPTAPAPLPEPPPTPIAAPLSVDPFHFLVPPLTVDRGRAALGPRGEERYQRGEAVPTPWPTQEKNVEYVQLGLKRINAQTDPHDVSSILYTNILKTVNARREKFFDAHEGKKFLDEEIRTNPKYRGLEGVEKNSERITLDENEAVSLSKEDGSGHLTIVRLDHVSEGDLQETAYVVHNLYEDLPSIFFTLEELQRYLDKKQWYSQGVARKYYRAVLNDKVQAGTAEQKPLTKQEIIDQMSTKLDEVLSAERYKKIVKIAENEYQTALAMMEEKSFATVETVRRINALLNARKSYDNQIQDRLARLTEFAQLQAQFEQMRKEGTQVSEDEEAQIQAFDKKFGEEVQAYQQEAKRITDLQKQFDSQYPIWSAARTGKSTS